MKKKLLTLFTLTLANTTTECAGQVEQQQISAAFNDQGQPFLPSNRQKESGKRHSLLLLLAPFILLCTTLGGIGHIIMTMVEDGKNIECINSNTYTYPITGSPWTPFPFDLKEQVFVLKTAAASIAGGILGILWQLFGFACGFIDVFLLREKLSRKTVEAIKYILAFLQLAMIGMLFGCLLDTNIEQEVTHYSSIVVGPDKEQITHFFNSIWLPVQKCWLCAVAGTLSPASVWQSVFPNYLGVRAAFEAAVPVSWELSPCGSIEEFENYGNVVYFPLLFAFSSFLSRMGTWWITSKLRAQYPLANSLKELFMSGFGK